MISLPSANSDLTHLNRPTTQWMLFFQQLAGQSGVNFAVSPQPINGGIVFADASVTGLFLDMPAPTAGGVVCVKKIDSTANAVVVNGNGATIDGLSAFTLPTQNDAVTMVSDGTNWFVISTY